MTHTASRAPDAEAPLSRDAVRFLTLKLHLSGPQCTSSPIARAATWETMGVIWARMPAHERARLGAARDQAMEVAEGRS